MIKISETIEKLRFLVELTKSGSIARRYFVIGAFDGALTILGVIIGVYMAESSLHPELAKPLIIAAGISAGVALAISSAVGAYEAERVEHILTHKNLEQAMLSTVEGTRRDAIQVSIVISAITHGVAPLIAAIIPLIPFFFLPLDEAVVMGIVITMAFLFALGGFLGNMIKERFYYTGLRFVIAGLATAIVLIMLGGHT
ncbi:MAG: VIT1/CCC1 transporter family protein [Thermoplasmata archaeon]|jgi:predicted membrane protein (TIGR00267 family)|nr:VIT1/CCC1 transporter family protein [Thermoplasmata archaeon]